MTNTDSIFFIGPQGSGKGTQARKLAEKLGFFYWEMGGIFRQIATEDTEVGKRIKALIDQGVLLDDPDIEAVIRAKIPAIPSSQGIVFDGVPRRIGQAEFLLGYLKELNRTNGTTIFLDVPKEITIERLLLRGETQGRADDNRAAIEKRLQYYYDSTLPVIDYLKTQTSLIMVDGTPSIDEVTETINCALGLTA